MERMSEPKGGEEEDRDESASKENIERFIGVIFDAKGADAILSFEKFCCNLPTPLLQKETPLGLATRYAHPGNLVCSSWILHISCNKRRISSIAALLSSVLHPVFFNDEIMHQIGNAPGPLKWFVQNLLEEGTKSPRTIRLAALHLTGLWLLNPRIIKFYLKELKLLSLYGL
ncbi:hypothetical protein S83_058911, partial [Arachis hypogaea]